MNTPTILAGRAFRTCAFGACQKPGSAVSMSIPSIPARPCFCSLLHAAMYLVWKLKVHTSEATRGTDSEPFRIDAEDALTAIERGRIEEFEQKEQPNVH
jgi:hypothetical protein